MEATAVWSEDELYDDINDHYRYMPNWFSNSNRSINNESDPFHKYGSFILFQYIDEHLGGPEIIKKTWDESRKRRNPHTDVSITSIDAALNNVGSSFNIALNSMRIANRIMSNHQNAEPYTYEEAFSYPVSGPNSIATLTFNKSEQINIFQNSLLLYSSHYYDLDINSPLKISIQNNSGPISDLFISTISKYSNSERWIIRHGNEINIDPEIGLEWSSLMINAHNNTVNNWDYSISLSNGSSEGFVISGIYPNPFIQSTVNSIITIKIFSSIGQDAIVNVYNMLGQKIINWKIEIPQGKEKDVHWDIKNRYRKSIANGIYFIEIKGKNSNHIEKITVLKSSN